MKTSDKSIFNRELFTYCRPVGEGKSGYTLITNRNASNTHSNTHFSTHFFWLVKINTGPIKSCGSHMNLVGPMWILTNQRECVEKCVLEGVLLAFP